MKNKKSTDTMSVLAQYNSLDTNTKCLITSVLQFYNTLIISIVQAQNAGKKEEK